MNEYNSVEYWSQNKADIKESEEEIEQFRVHQLHKKFILAALEPIKQDITSVFEIGCGYGRITKVILDNLPNITKYNAIDVSLDKVEGAIKYIPLRKYWNKLKIWNDDFLNLKRPQPFECYDLVIATEVLMHQTPALIEKWIAKMDDFARSYIINIDWYEDNPHYPQGIAFHNFIHRYDDLYSKIIPDARVIFKPLQPITKQRFYFIIKK